MELLNVAAGFRLDPEAEFNGADLTIHKIGATAERETSWQRAAARRPRCAVGRADGGSAGGQPDAGD